MSQEETVLNKASESVTVTDPSLLRGLEQEEETFKGIQRGRDCEGLRRRGRKRDLSVADSTAFNLGCQIPFHLTPSQPA